MNKRISVIVITLLGMFVFIAILLVSLLTAKPRTLSQTIEKGLNPHLPNRRVICLQWIHGGSLLPV